MWFRVMFWFRNMLWGYPSERVKLYLLWCIHFVWAFWRQSEWELIGIAGFTLQLFSEREWIPTCLVRNSRVLNESWLLTASETEIDPRRAKGFLISAPNFGSNKFVFAEIWFILTAWKSLFFLAWLALGNEPIKFPKTAPVQSKMAEVTHGFIIAPLPPNEEVRRAITLKKKAFTYVFTYVHAFPHWIPNAG